MSFLSRDMSAASAVLCFVDGCITQRKGRKRKGELLVQVQQFLQGVSCGMRVKVKATEGICHNIALAGDVAEFWPIFFKEKAPTNNSVGVIGFIA